MPQYTRVYDDAQRGGIVEAGVDRGVRPISRICRMAYAGELTFEGDQIPSFQIPDASARAIVEKARKGREGRNLSDLAAKPPKDAIELLRRRFLNLIDYELTRVEKQAKRKNSKPIDAALVRNLVRAGREAAALPGPEDKRLPMQPGSNTGAGRTEGQTRDSLGGSILNAARRSSQHAATYTPDLGVDEDSVESDVSDDDVGSSPSVADYALHD